MNLKKLFGIMLLAGLQLHTLAQQNIGIGTNVPHASAILELNSTSKGFLLPRLTSEQRNQVGSPATGLMVFDITTNSPWVYNGTTWVEALNNNIANWVYNGITLYNPNGGNVGIGLENATNRFQVRNMGEGENDFIVSYSGAFGIGGTSATGRFFVRNDLAGNDSSFFITRRGRIGSGISNPLGRLQIQNDISGTDSSLIFTESGDFGIGTDFPFGRFHLRNDMSGVDSTFIVLRNGYAGVGTVLPQGPFHFAGDVLSGQDSNFIVTRGARVGVGTSTPFGRLHIANDVSGTDSVFIVTMAGYAGLGTLNPAARLHVDNSSVLFSAEGLVPAAAEHLPLPATGEGRRMMWYPDKAAFRTGYVSANQWNYDSIGTYSFSAGFNARAHGNSGSVAMGLNALATGVNGAIAVGSDALAMGTSSVAMGRIVRTFSQALGGVALGEGSAVFSRGGLAGGFYSRVIDGDGGIALGYQNEVNYRGAFAGGYVSKAYGGEGAIALGYSVEAANDGAVALGYNTKAEGFGSTAIGKDNRVTATAGFVAGINSEANNGNASSVLGSNLKATSYGGTVVGVFNNASLAGSIYDISNNNRVFQVGNGTADNLRSNALTVLQNGNIGVGVLTPEHNLVVNKDIRLDAFEVNNGTLSSPLLRFGPSNTGEAIGSKRTEGGNRWGLDFYTGNQTRMSITNTGRIGIGTTNPFKGLVHIEGAVSNLLSSYGFLNSAGNTGSAGGTNPYSLYASDRIAASEFNAHSDRRIKSNIETSDGALDLQRLQHIRITDYGFADHVTRGNQRVKGLIAQELKEVLPSAVSTTGGFVPDIYCISTSNRFNEQGKTLTVEICKAHGLKPGDRVQLLAGESRYEQTVVQVINDQSFTVADWEPALVGANPVQQVFVYGKFVNDFHSVDYNQVLATGISAIQELSRQHQTLKNDYAEAVKRIERLEKLLLRQ